MTAGAANDWPSGSWSRLPRRAGCPRQGGSPSPGFRPAPATSSAGHSLLTQRLGPPYLSRKPTGSPSNVRISGVSGFGAGTWLPDSAEKRLSSEPALHAAPPEWTFIAYPALRAGGTVTVALLPEQGPHEEVGDFGPGAPESSRQLAEAVIPPRMSHLDRSWGVGCRVGALFWRMPHQQRRVFGEVRQQIRPPDRHSPRDDFFGGGGTMLACAPTSAIAPHSP